MKTVSEMFGTMVFNDEVMKERLPEEVYKSLQNTIQNGKHLDLSLANVVASAINAIKTCDLLIVGGTSLAVYPAASYIRYFEGKYLVIINNDSTIYDNQAQLVIHDKLGNVFSKLN